MSSRLRESGTASVAFGVITVILTVIGWSSIPLFLRHFAEMIDAWTANGWRYGVSALIWAPVLILVALKRGLPPGLWKQAIVPSIVNAAGQVCFTYAHYRIDPGLLTFGLRSQLLFVAIGAWIMFPAERRIIGTRGYLLGGVVLVLGMIAVIVFDSASSGENAAQAIEGTGAAWGSHTSYIIGVALSLASGMLFASYGLAVRKYMHGINPVIAFAAICQYTAAVMIGLMFAFGTNRGMTALEMTSEQFSLLLLSAVIGIAVGHVFYYISIARLGVAVTAGVLQIQPFLVAIGSLALFHEILTAGQWTGGCVSVCGALMMLNVQYRLSREQRSLEDPLAIAEGAGGS